MTPCRPTAMFPVGSRSGGSDVAATRTVPPYLMAGVGDRTAVAGEAPGAAVVPAFAAVVGAAPPTAVPPAAVTVAAGALFFVLLPLQASNAMAVRPLPVNVALRS